jgi:hypothetical protein
MQHAEHNIDVDAKRLRKREIQRGVDARRKEKRRAYELLNRSRINANKRRREREERLAKHQFVNAIKAQPCADCGNRFPPVAMDFDHVRGVKRGNVSQMIARNRATLDGIRAEVEKCEVVCANCHRLRTHARRMAARGGR